MCRNAKLNVLKCECEATKNPPEYPAGFLCWQTVSKPLLDFSYVGGLQPFGAVNHIERYGLAFGEGFETFTLDGGEVYEYVFAVFLLDETETLGVVEPLNFALCHFPTSFGASGPLPEIR
jgi:hypothetical protein